MRIVLVGGGPPPCWSSRLCLVVFVGGVGGGRGGVPPRSLPAFLACCCRGPSLVDVDCWSAVGLLVLFMWFLFSPHHAVDVGGSLPFSVSRLVLGCPPSPTVQWKWASLFFFCSGTRANLPHSH